MRKNKHPSIVHGQEAVVPLSNGRYIHVSISSSPRSKSKQKRIEKRLDKIIKKLKILNSRMEGDKQVDPNAGFSV